MCEPATLAYASFALASATAVGGFVAQNKAAKAQAEALSEAQYLEQNDLQRRQTQESAAASEQMNSHALQAAREMATAEAVVGEYGGGSSVDRGLALVGQQAGQRLATLEANASRVSEQTAFDSIASSRRSASQLASIQRPSILGTALQIGDAAVRSKATLNNINNPLPRKQ